MLFFQDFVRFLGLFVSFAHPGAYLMLAYFSLRAKARKRTNKQKASFRNPGKKKKYCFLPIHPVWWSLQPA